MTSLVRKKKKNGGLMPALETNFSELFDLDKFFNEPFLMGAMWNGWRQSIVPPANINETDTEYIVEMAVPGMKKDDFDIDIDNGCLEIKVEKEEETKEDKKKYKRREYRYNSFYRSFDLPENVKADDINARYEDGVLKILLPKIEKAKKKETKKIAVK